MYYTNIKTEDYKLYLLDNSTVVSALLTLMEKHSSIMPLLINGQEPAFLVPITEVPNFESLLKSLPNKENVMV